MPLPQPGTNWPPAPYGPLFDQFDSNAAWMEGDTEALQRLYTPGGDQDVNSAVWRKGVLQRGGIRNMARRWWNGQPLAAGANYMVTRIHSPLAGNLARLSATMLVSEPPTVRLIEEVDDPTREGQRVRQAVKNSNTQDAIEHLLQSDEAHIALRRGSEWAAGLGSCAYSWSWDETAEPSEKLTLSVHPGDLVIPEYVNGRLTAITMFDVYPTKGDGVLRHLMRHESGNIVHALYLGRSDKLGDRVPFTSRVVAEFAPDLAAIAGVSRARDEGGIVFVPTGTTRLTAALHVNLPTIRFGKHNTLAHAGRADIEGAEQFLDAHDEVWSSWMRDLKLARARMIVADVFLEGRGAGSGAYFDDLAELFTPINQMNLSDNDLSKGMHAQQFDIRFEAHERTAQATLQTVLESVGWSRSSYGEATERQGSDNTATGVVDRAKRTENTRDEKMPHLRITLRNLTLVGLDLYRQLNPTAGVEVVTAGQIEVKFADVSQIDPEKQARTIQYLDSAKAISVDTKVRMLHPEWDNGEVEAEVKRILDDTPVLVDPFAAPDNPGTDAPTVTSGDSVGAAEGTDAGRNDQPGGTA